MHLRLLLTGIRITLSSNFSLKRTVKYIHGNLHVNGRKAAFSSMTNNIAARIFYEKSYPILSFGKCIYIQNYFGR